MVMLDEKGTSTPTDGYGGRARELPAMCVGESWRPENDDGPR